MVVVGKKERGWAGEGERERPERGGRRVREKDRGERGGEGGRESECGGEREGEGADVEKWGEKVEGGSRTNSQRTPITLSIAARARRFFHGGWLVWTPWYSFHENV